MANTIYINSRSITAIEIKEETSGGSTLLVFILSSGHAVKYVPETSAAFKEAFSAAHEDGFFEIPEAKLCKI